MRVCAPARGERMETLFKGTFVLPCDAFQRRGYLSKVLQRKATLRLFNRPSLRNKAPLFRKKLHRFQENLPRFRENLLRFLKKLHRFEKISHVFSVLSYVLNYTPSGGEREIMNFWSFRFDVLKRGSTLWLTSSELVCLQRISIALGAKKNPTHRRMNGIFYCSAQCWLPHQGRN